MLLKMFGYRHLRSAIEFLTFSPNCRISFNIGKTLEWMKFNFICFQFINVQVSCARVGCGLPSHCLIARTKTINIGWLGYIYGEDMLTLKFELFKYKYKIIELCITYHMSKGSHEYRIYTGKKVQLKRIACQIVKGDIIKNHFAYFFMV